MRLRRFAAGAVFLLLLGVAAEQLHVSEEEAIVQQMEGVAEALAAEDLGQLRGLLSETISVSGPQPIGSGEGEASWARARRLFDEAEGIRLSWSAQEVQIQGQVARAQTTGRVRFRWGEILVVYRIRAVLEFRRDGVAWVLERVQVSELQRGL